MKLCEQFKEWWNTGGMGDTCLRPLAHDDDHVGASGVSWPRSTTERKLAAEIRRLQGMVDSIEKLADEIRHRPTGKFLAEELARRMEKYA